MKRPKRGLPRAAEEAQRRAAGLASSTKGRARTFIDRKSEADRRACRGAMPLTPAEVATNSPEVVERLRGDRPDCPDLGDLS